MLGCVCLFLLFLVQTSSDWTVWRCAKGLYRPHAVILGSAVTSEALVLTEHTLQDWTHGEILHISTIRYSQSS